MIYNILLKYSPEVLRELAPGVLEEMLVDAQRLSYELREQTSIYGRASNPDLFGKVKKDIARIKTLINEGS